MNLRETLKLMYVNEASGERNIKLKEYWNTGNGRIVYDELLKDGKIDPVVGDVLDIVETALAYRKSLKDAEKAEKKRQKKNRAV